jgi:hypothetical protein
MYPTSTDGELIRCAHAMGNKTLLLFAQRLQERGITAENARAELLAALRVIDNPGASEAARLQAIDTARQVARMIDWRHDVPGYPAITDQLQREAAKKGKL